LCAVASLAIAQQEHPTPYDLIRPVWPLTWDSTIFKTNFTPGPKRVSLPSKNTPEYYAPNEIITPDTLNQAYIDAMVIQISPIRVNQAGYRPQDAKKPVLYVGSATNFDVVNAKGEVVGKGNFTETLKNSVSSSLTIKASNNAQTEYGGDHRYTAKKAGPSGALKKGFLPDGLPENERLRIKVGNDYSSTFIISDRVYSMLRDAVLKFYGINRSGNSESWFHPPSHLKDGSLANVDMTGGWYDCGDHLKESQTIAYSVAQLAMTAAAYEDRDQDNYAFNQGEAQNTDNIPDILREAKFGAEYVIKAYDAAKGVVSAMPVSIGDIGKDHGWWGSPEYQDNTLHDRGGPTARILRSDDKPGSDAELGSTASGNFAAGLAIVSKIWNKYDTAFAKKSLTVAKALYEYGKSKKKLTNSPAYSGGSTYHDEMGFAAVCLFYATADKTYLNDAVEDKSLAGGQTKKDFANSDKKGAGMFNGGWFAHKEASYLKSNAASDWASVFTSGLYAFYKLILETQEKASAYGLSNEQRMIYIEDVAFTMAANLAGVMTGGTEKINLPAGQAGWVGTSISYDPIWGLTSAVKTDWWTKYEAANIFELLAYYDVTKDLENVTMPQTGTIQSWKSDEILELAISHMNYYLGMNPWDVSLIYGVGDKNHAHPHHRGSNPEGKNVAGVVSTYKYRSPVGGLGPAAPPTGMDDLSVHFDNYKLTENTCIDAVSNFLPAAVLLAKSEDLNRAPAISVEIRHVDVDSAIVFVKLDLGSYAYITYDTTETLKNPMVASSETATNQHQIVLRDLKPGTTYYFYAMAKNPRSGNTSQKWLVDSTSTPFSFTTLNTLENANIQNVSVCNVTADSAEIMWYTPNGEYNSKVYWDTIPHSNLNEYAFNTGDGNADISGIPTQFHYVKIGGLKERTTYYYAVESNGVYTNVNEKNEPLKFKTPVMQYKFEVRMSQYVWDPMPALEINIINNEERPFDSLTLRLYMRATDEIYYDVGIRRDICQAYNEAAFNDTCSAATQKELDGLFRKTFPQKIEDTYDPTDGTWQWYFPIPLGSTIIKSTSRLRIDVMFDRRSEWEPHLDLMNDTPKKKFYCNDGSSWTSQAKDKLPQNPGDWSWMPHSRENGDYADFEGIPCLPKNFGDDDLAPINPYVSIYRKDEFVWGYSPSKKEMEVKKAKYDLSVSLNPPFNVSNGSHIDIDQNNSTVHVKGKARVSENGYITKIWANGVKVSGQMFNDGLSLDKWLMDESGSNIIAKYDFATDMWDLDIPVKMGIGSNKIDVTIFAGPDPNCETCSENGGCAFENRSFYVNFTKGDATASQLVLKDANGNPVVSPANPDGTIFYIDLMDKDKIKSKASSVDVLIINNKKNDQLKVTLNADPNNPGHFVGGPITAVNHSKESRNPNSEISFFAGDTIQVVYTDPDDEDDVSKQTFFAESKVPSPQSVYAIDSDCDNKADQLKIVFTNKIAEGYTLDSIKFYIEGMADTIKMPLVAANFADKNEVVIPIDTSLIQTSANPSGKITTYVADRGTANAETAKITDGILPTLTSVSILEKADENSDEDTVMVAFSEPVILSSLNEWPLVVSGATAAPTVVSNATTTNNGKSWQFVISGNKNKDLVPVGATVAAKSTSSFSITDQSFNQLDPVGCNPTVPITLISRPVPIYHAEMIDQEGDGVPDVVYMMFERRLKKKDVFDSIVTVWGNPGITRSFVTTADTTGIYISPKETYWTIRDSISAPRTVMIDSVNTEVVVDTFSIVEVNLKKVPAALTYPYGSTSGENDGNGTVSPLKGVANGFFETSYTLYDKCAPVIATARMIKEGVLSVNFSEPLNMQQTGRYIQRERDEYIPPEMPQGAGKSQLFTYNEKDNVFHAGDRVRLVPQELDAAYIDKSKNVPTKFNPYVRITGDDNIRFSVTLTNPVATPKTGAYMGRPESTMNDAFVTSAIINGKRHFINGNGTLLGQADSAAYVSSGPNFEIEVVMPSANFNTHEGKPMYDFHLKIVTDLYDNLGQYINTYRLDIPKENFSTIRNLTNNGTLKLNVEWAAKDNEAPVAKKGNKIGTGAYIAKFDFTAEPFCAAVFDQTSNDYKASCSTIGEKTGKATDSKTKTLGFKRRK
jgi:hypothetical protein